MLNSLFFFFFFSTSSGQNITFAESTDLIHWTNGLEKNESNTFPWFNIDPDLYQVQGGRWDTIYSIPVPGKGTENPRDGYPRYGYWTASPLKSVNGGQGGTFGLGITEDGVNWKALPAPKMEPEAIGAELGAVEHVKPGVYVAMLGYGWYNDFDIIRPTLLRSLPPTPSSQPTSGQYQAARHFELSADVRTFGFRCVQIGAEGPGRCWLTPRRRRPGHSPGTPRTSTS